MVFAGAAYIGHVHSDIVQINTLTDDEEKAIEAFSNENSIDSESNNEIEKLASQFYDEWGDKYEANEYDCSDMALQLYWWYWKNGYKVQLVIGNLDYDEKSLSDCNHAWILVWSDSDPNNTGWLAVDATNGDVFYDGVEYELADGTKINGHSYYTGYIFNNTDDYLKALYLPKTKYKY